MCVCVCVCVCVYIPKRSAFGCMRAMYFFVLMKVGSLSKRVGVLYDLHLYGCVKIACKDHIPLYYESSRLSSLPFLLFSTSGLFLSFLLLAWVLYPPESEMLAHHFSRTCLNGLSR